jgi:lysophospholipase L1-like esterase
VRLFLTSNAAFRGSDVIAGQAPLIEYNNPMLVLVIVMVACSSARAALVVVALGDSVTKGVRRDGSVLADQTFVAVLERELRKTYPDARVINSGIGGNTSSQMLARLDKDVLSHHPQVTLVMTGLSDAEYIDPGPPRDTPRVALNVFADELRQIIRRVRDAGGQVLLLTPNPMTGKYLYASQGYYKEHDVNSALDSYAASIRSVALETHTDLVDVYADWIHIPRLRTVLA